MKSLKLCLLALLAGIFSLSAAQLVINRGTGPNTGDGDSLRTAAGKINTNFTEVYTTLYTNGVTRVLESGGTTLIVGSITNGQVITRSGTNLVGSAAGSGDLKFTDLDPDWLRTNGAVVRPALGKTFPSWVNVADENYAATLDGVTDISAAVQQAVNDLPARRGGTVYIPGPAKFSGIVITNHNVRILGESPAIDDVAANTNYWIPASATNFMFKVGDGTTIVRGFTLERATLNGTTGSTNGHFAVWFNGVTHSDIKDTTILGFRTNLLYSPTGSQPVHTIRMWGGRLQGHASDTNQVLAYVYMPTNQSPYTTDIMFTGTKVATPQTVGSFGFVVDGTSITLNNVYIDQGQTNSSVVLRKTNGSSVPVSYVHGEGSTIDPTQTNWVSILVEYATSKHVEDYMKGAWKGVKGRLQLSDGSQLEGPGAPALYGPYQGTFLGSTEINGALVFNEGTRTAQWDGSRSISRSSGALVIDNTGGSINLTPNSNLNIAPATGDILISSAKIVLDNNEAIQFKDSAATAETTLIVTGGNNLQIATPTLGGSLQLITRNTGNSILIDSGNNGTDFSVAARKVNINPATGDAATPANGDVWYNSTTGKFRKHEGGVTSDLDTTGGAGSVYRDGTSVSNPNFKSNTNITWIEDAVTNILAVVTNVSSSQIVDATIVDGDIAASGITTRSKLPSAIAYEDENNTFSERITLNGDIIVAQSEALTVNWDATGDNVTTLSTNAAFTIAFSGTPQTGASRTFILTNTASSDITVTIPSSFSIPDAADITSLTMLANSRAAFRWYRNSGGYILFRNEKDNPRLTGIIGLGSGGGLLALTDSTNSALRTLTESTAIDVTNGNGVSGNPTVAWDSTEVNNTTWGDGTQAAITNTYNVSTGTDPIWIAGNNFMNLSAGALQEGGNDIFNSSEVPGGELGGTWASPTIDDSVTVATWTMTGAPGLAVNNGATGSGSIDIAEDSDNGSHRIRLTVPASVASDKTATFPDATGTLVLEDNTATLTGKTYDAAATGNVLKFIDYKDFVYPAKVDGTGCTILTNDYSNPLWGLATFNGTGETNANWSFYRLGVVPMDLDTSVELVLENLAVRVSGTDADAATLDFGIFSPASSSGHAPTAWSSFGTFIRASVTPSTPAAEDIFYFADITLTGWAAAVTSGRPFIIGIARLNTTNDDSITIVSGDIKYTRTK